MRLSPLDPEMFRMQAGMAMAHLFAGRFDSASSWAEKAFRDLPSFLMVVGIIAASHALAGRMDDAQRAMQHVRQLDPTLRISNLDGLASDPPAGGSRDVCGRPAKSRAAGMTAG